MQGGFYWDNFVSETIKVEIMKAKTLLFVIAACLCLLPASVYGASDIRVHARFLTDRMAFELHLNTNQYNDLYEINYDFFTGISPYMARMAIADAVATDLYYHYLDIRNDDLRWVLSNAEYARFIALDYFFRPVYVAGGVCRLRVYTVYSDRNLFHFAPPRHYLTYRGGHCRTHFGGESYYRKAYPVRYRHPVYAHARPARPATPKPRMRPHSNPGFRFTPADNRRPGAARPSKPQSGKPQVSRPGRPNRPGQIAPGVSKPGKPQVQRKPDARRNNPAEKKSRVRSARDSRQSGRTAGARRM